MRWIRGVLVDGPRKHHDDDKQQVGPPWIQITCPPIPDDSESSDEEDGRQQQAGRIGKEFQNTDQTDRQRIARKPSSRTAPVP